MEFYPRFDYDLRAPLARGERAYPWYWGGMPKGVFGIHADNNTLHKRVYLELVGALTLGVTCQLKSCGMLNRG